MDNNTWCTYGEICLYLFFIKLGLLFLLQIRERSLKLIREWVASQQHLKGCCRPEARLKLDDPKCDYAKSFLLRFLRVNKFSIKKSTSMMESYIRMKNDYPHWYQGLGDWENEQFMELVIR